MQNGRSISSGINLSNNALAQVVAIFEEAPLCSLNIGVTASERDDVP